MTRSTGSAGSIRSAVGLRAPLYHRIYLILRHQILDGAFSDGDLLPGEQDLAASFDVSRITARRALDELAAEGLAQRAQGKGTFVRAPQPMPAVEARTEGLFENLIAMGLKTTATLVSFGYRAAPADVATRLETTKGAEIQHAVRIRSLEGAPISHLTTWVPAEIGRTYSEADMAREPLLALLERAGVHVQSADQTITAGLADAEMAPLLETEVGAPLLRLSRVVRDRDGRPVELLTALYRPDRYQHRMRMERVTTDGTALWEPVPTTSHPMTDREIRT